MKCSDVDRILPEIIDGSASHGASHETRFTSDQDLEFQSHLRACPHCSELVSDLKLISSEAHHLSDSEEPSPAVWLRIAAELRAEGLIRDPELAAMRPILVPAPRPRWNAFWLAPITVAILAAGSYFLTHKSSQPPPAQIAKKSQAQEAPQTQASQMQANQPEATEATVAQNVAPVHAARTEATQPSGNSADQSELSAPSGSDDQQFLSEVSSRAPTMRVTYENQLRAVNSEIRETQAYINRFPADLDARQHLMEVYQQKAMLYQIALDRIQ
jgi:hypothetical protein